MYKMNKCMCNNMHMNPYQSMNKRKGMFVCPMMNMYYMNQYLMPCHKLRTPETMNIKDEDDKLPKLKMKTVKLKDLVD